MSESKTPEWAETLPDDLKSHPAIANTPDVATLAKRLVDLDSYKGRSIALPKEGDEASMRAFTEAVSKRGFTPGLVPSDPAGYEFGEDAPDDDWVKSRAEDYHKIGLTSEQAKRALKAELELRTQQESKLATFSEADRKAAKKAAEAFGVDLGDPVSVFNLLKEVGSNMTTGEDSFRVGGGAGAPETPESLDLKLHEMNLEMQEIPNWDPRHKAMLNQKALLLQRKAALQSGEPIKPKPLGELRIGGKSRAY